MFIVTDFGIEIQKRGKGTEFEREKERNRKIQKRGKETEKKKELTKKRERLYIVYE